ncbi:MAG: SIS domain-containing protein [Anaerolineaceae bacterium]|nr:SIS domain-containing protein [Anaerolineaceae bacterium]
MTDRGLFTLKEILSQPQAWKSALEILDAQSDDLRYFFNKSAFEMVLFSGCGSTYYLSLAASALFQQLVGRWSIGIPASVIWLNPRVFPGKGNALLVMISRSGETSESIRACEKFRSEKGGSILTLSCYSDTPLTRLGDRNLILPSGQEQSIAQTRAFSTLYLATTYLSSLWSGGDDRIKQMRKLPTVAEKMMAAYRPMTNDLGREGSIERIHFLGSGARYGLACELNLKMKEMSLSHSEAFHFMEFRHGPQSMVNDHTLVVGLLSDENRKHEDKVLDEMRSRGAWVLGIADKNADINFKSGVLSPIRNVLYLPLGQLLAYERALDRGRDPDHPNNLQAVVKLD